MIKALGADYARDPRTREILPSALTLLLICSDIEIANLWNVT